MEVLPATGQTGCGRSMIVHVYQYPGGPETDTYLYDEAIPPNVARHMAYTRDHEGQVKTVTSLSPTGGTVEKRTYFYDAANRLSTVTDGNGHVTTYQYDAAHLTDRLAAIVYPNNGGYAAFDRVAYAYNADGSVNTRTDGYGLTGGGAGSTATYSYDGVSTSYPATGTGDPTGVSYGTSSPYNVTLGYDDYERVTSEAVGPSASSPNAQTTYALGAADEVTSATTDYTGFGGPGTGLGVSYTYGPDGQRATMTVPHEANAFTYGYDDLGRLTSVENPLSETTSWLYTANGWVSRETLPNGNSTTYATNGRGEVTSQQDVRSDGQLLTAYQGDGVLSNDLLYDAAGNLVNMKANAANDPAYSGTVAYQYDGAGRLTQEQNGRLGYTFSQTYDGNGATTFGNGNLLTFTSINPNHVTTFNSDDQDASNAYDGAGNPTSYGMKTLTYDPASRLTNFNGQMTAAYDAEGMRAKRVVGTTASYYVYDGDEPVEEVSSTGTVTALETYGANGRAARSSGGSPSTFYQYDPMGNVSHRSDGTATTLSSDLYDAWGNAIAGSSTDPFGYGAQVGYYTDHESGLMLLGHRYYDPTRGRFLNRDPIGYDGGDNLYGYVGDDPTTWVDPDGLSGIGAVGGVVKGVGVGIGKAMKFNRSGVRGAPPGEINLMGPKPNSGWKGGTRTLHLDEPHGSVDFYHINADIGPLAEVGQPIGHIRISKGIYDALNETTVRQVGNIAVGLGIVIDVYSVVSAPADQRMRAIGDAASGWAGAWAGAEVGSMFWPGPGSFLGGVAGALISVAGFDAITSSSVSSDQGIQMSTGDPCPTPCQ